MATPEQRNAWESMRGFAKREVGGKLQVGRYQIRTDSIDWFDYPLSRPPTIASTEPAGLTPAIDAARAMDDMDAAHDKPIKKRASKRKKSKG